MARRASHLRGKWILTNLGSVLLPMTVPKGFCLLHEVPDEMPRAALAAALPVGSETNSTKGDAGKNVSLANDLENCL